MQEIDWNKQFSREHLSKEYYEEKFRLCELLKDSKHPDVELYKRLLTDVTTFACLFFQMDGQPLRLYPYQDAIINDKHRFKIFRAANQIGKSLLFDIKAAYNLIMDNGHAHNEAIVSKSLPQSIHQMRRIKSILNTTKFSGLRDQNSGTDNMSVMTFDIKDDKGVTKYSNTLICAPCTEGLLGYDLHELNLDEFEYWDIDVKYFFNQIAQPRTYTTKGNITIFSNPNGAESFVAELENQVLKKGNKKWHTYVFDYLDKPGNTLEEYDQLKHELSRQEFESTVAAIRSISSKNYFTRDEIERSYDESLNEVKMVGQQPYFFLDVGAKHDQSVLVGGFTEPYEENERLKKVYIPIIHVYPVGYPMSRVVGAEVDNSDGWHYEKSVKEYLQEWGMEGINPTFGVDVTGNSGIIPLFEAINVFPEDVTFSGPNKSGMYQRFKYFMEKGLLHRIKNKEWEYQAEHMEIKKGEGRGYLKIHHEREDDLDDCMDATAGLIFLSDNPEIIPTTFKVVEYARR